MSGDKFNIWYNKQLNQIDEEVDESLWGDIENELDFQETWNNISSRLDEKELQGLPLIKRRSFVKEVIGIAAGILMILATAKYISDHTGQVTVATGNTSLNTRYIRQKIKAITDNASRETIKGIYETGFFNNTAYPYYSPDAREDERHMTGSVTISAGERTQSWTELEGQPSITGYSLESERPEHDLSYHTGYFKNRKFSDETSYKGNGSNVTGFKDAGIIFGYRNTWLFNHETFNGLNPSKLNNTLATYRQEFGVTTTLVLKSRINLGMEFFWSSEVGQKYQQYINASYMDRNIDLDYLKFQTFYIWDQNNIPGEVLLGGYYSILKAVKETQGGVSFNVKKNYSNFDYGLLFGYQLEMDIYNRLTLKPGLRFNYNMRNIFEGDNIVPAYMKKTNSFSAGFNLSVTYKIF